MQVVICKTAIFKASKVYINLLYLEIMFLVTKFDEIVNILKPSNQKLEAKFFELFQFLYFIEKLAYKLKLLKKLRYNIFHILL